jgi:hypothetical protein
MDKRINENTAAIHRASVSKAFNAKPAPEKKKSQIDKDIEDLQAALGKDVVVKPEMKAKGGKVKKFENGGDVYDNYERRSRINEAIRREGLAPYEIKELEMKKPKDKVDKTIKPIGSSIGKGPGDSFNYEKAEKALAEYRARMGSDAGGKTIRSSGGGGGGAGIPKVGPKRPLDMKSGGKVSSASKRADGCAIKGKTKGKMR